MPLKVSVGQQRWNQIGSDRIKEIQHDPSAFIVSRCPIAYLKASVEILALLGDLDGKRVLELGCGRGEFSVWMARQGALVSAVDIGSDLLVAASALADINGVECDFRHANITELPYESSVFDLVIGCAILHHLSEADVLKALKETRRVLRPNSRAVFYESVENSRVFNFVQNLVPRGKRGQHYYRPSILNRKEWAEYTASLDDRDMTTQELIAAGAGLFRFTRLSPYGFLIRLERLFNHHHAFDKCDNVIFMVLPFLRRYCQTVVVEYQS